MGFRSYIRQFSGAILMLSVLHCHGDLLLVVVRFLASLQSSFSIGFRRVAGAGAAAGGNRRKKSLKSSFSMGFRSYIRQFLGAILMLFRPSLQWGFAARSLGFRRVAGAAAAGGNRRKKSLKSSFSMGFRNYIRQFLVAILMLFRASLPWGFAARSGSIFGVAACYRSSRSRSSSSSSSSRKQEEKVATIIFFYRFQKTAAGGNRRKKSLKSSFSMGFRCYIRQFSGAILMFSVLHCHGDLLLGVVRFLASLQSSFSIGFRRVAGAGAAAAAAGGNRRNK